MGEIFRLLFNLATSRLQGIIAVSKSVKDGPLCKASIPLKVCYLGSDIQLKGSEIDEIKNARFLFLGRMVDIKRPLWLIERISNLRNQVTLGKGCLTIVGDGPLLEDARKLISALDLKDFVTLTGQQSDVVPYLLESNYLVSCSENEGLPITFYEAKLAGLRIISTPSGGGVEIFDENDFVTSGFSEIEFEAALERAILDPLPSLIERRKTSEAASWMSAQSCAVNYYEALITFLGRDGYR